MALFTFVVVAVIMSSGAGDPENQCHGNLYPGTVCSVRRAGMYRHEPGKTSGYHTDSDLKKFALIGMILISVGMVVGSWMISRNRAFYNLLRIEGFHTGIFFLR